MEHQITIFWIEIRWSEIFHIASAWHRGAEAGSAAVRATCKVIATGAQERDPDLDRDAGRKVPAGCARSHTGARPRIELKIESQIRCYRCVRPERSVDGVLHRLG